MTHPTDQSSREQEREAFMRAMQKALLNILALAAGWDEFGATAPRSPMSWESVGRLSLDFARHALSTLPPTAITAEEAGREGEAKDAALTDRQSREAHMTVLDRDAKGVPTIWCDPEIADIVAALNTHGLKTVASCSGHGQQLGIVSLADGRELTIGTTAAREGVVHDWPACAVFRGGLCTCDAGDGDSNPRCPHGVTTRIRCESCETSKWGVASLLRAPGEAKARYVVCRVIWKNGEPTSEYLRGPDGDALKFATLEEARSKIHEPSEPKTGLDHFVADVESALIHGQADDLDEGQICALADSHSEETFENGEWRFSYAGLAQLIADRSSDTWDQGYRQAMRDDPRLSQARVVANVLALIAKWRHAAEHLGLEGLASLADCADELESALSAPHQPVSAGKPTKGWVRDGDRWEPQQSAPRGKPSESAAVSGEVSEAVARIEQYVARRTGRRGLDPDVVVGIDADVELRLSDLRAVLALAGSGGKA